MAFPGTPCTVTIGGDTVVGDDFGAHSWPRKFGTTAPEVVWCLPPATVAKLLALPTTPYGFRETTIVIKTAARTRTIKRVVVLKENPSEDPNRRYLVLSNVLAYLPRRDVTRRYNWRTATGATRIVNAEGLPVQIASVVAVQTYAPSTLFGGGLRPYKAIEILQDVESVVSQAFGITFTHTERPRGTYVPENIILDAPANQAYAQALGGVGGVDVTVEDDGSVTVKDAYLGAEKAVIQKFFTYSLDGHGTLRWVDMGGLAPVTINGLFTKQMEVRGDYWEPAPGTAAAAAPPDVGNLPIFTNVIPIVDQVLTVTDPDTLVAYPAYKGSLIDADPWFAAVAADTRTPPIASAPLPFSRLTFLQKYLSPKTLTMFAVDPLGSQPPSQVWLNRVRAAHGSLRTLLRLNKNFANRCVPDSIIDVRAAVVDAQTGTRQKSVCFMDYAQRPTSRGMLGEPNYGWDQSGIPPDVGQSPAATKVYGSPAEVWPTTLLPIVGCTVAPAKVDVLDRTNGVFSVTAVKEPFDHTSEIIPSLVYQLPSCDIQKCVLSAQGGGAGTTGSAVAANPFWENASLVLTDRKIIIFTATPMGPNNEACLQEYQVPFVTALIRLGVDVNSVKAKGPAYDVRVQPGDGRLAARFAWTDALGPQILATFYNTAVAPSSTPNNLGLTPVNDLELNDYTISLAAQLMAAFLDHYEGDADIAWSDIGPVGALVQSTDTITEKGEIFTSVSCRPSVPPVNVEQLLKPSTRQALFGVIGQ